MRCVLSILCLLLPSIAAAEPELDSYVRSARTMARRGDCAAVAAVSLHVRKLSPDFHIETFSRDPEIANCTPARPSDVVVVIGRQPKSETTALGLSLGLTVAGGVALAVAGTSESASGSVKVPLAIAGLGLVLVGPTAGHSYAGNTWNRGLQVRLGSLAVVVTSVAAAISVCPPFSGCSGSDRDKTDALATIAIVGVIGYGSAMLYEIASAGHAAKQANLKILPTGNGLAAFGRF